MAREKHDVIIAAAARTPIAKFEGDFRELECWELGAAVLKGAYERAKLTPEEVSCVVMGNILTAGVGMNPARQASIHAGLPDSVPAWIVNQVCGSGLRSVIIAAQMIESGECDIVLAGGQESMSRARHAALIRFGKKMGNVKFEDTLMLDGLTDAFAGCAMGITAENIAERFGISREEQDKWALRSQQRALRAVESGFFDEEIVPVKTKEGMIKRDSAPRTDTDAEKLAKLKPAFREMGTVTAGNSSSIDDGAAAVVVMTLKEAERRKLQPLGRIVSYAQAGVDPQIMGIGPIPASKLALKRAGWTSDDLDLIEENEAFAAQTVYVIREMGWPEEKINIHGGAIALGHPIGATGARLLATLLYSLKRQNKQKGLITLCIGGGMGIAMCVERV